MADTPEYLISEAEKCVKKGFFKTPDYDAAIDLLKKAANKYFFQKSHQKCADVYLKIAHYHQENKSLFHSGKALEQAGNCYRILGNINEMISVCEKAADLMFDSNVYDTGVNILKDLAGRIEDSHPAKSAEIYEKAATRILVSLNYIECANTLRKAGDINVKANKKDRAIENFRRSIEIIMQSKPSEDSVKVCHKIVVQMVILSLLRDTVEASKVVAEAVNNCEFGKSEHYSVVNRLINGLEIGDRDEVDVALNSHTFSHLDQNVMKVVPQIPLPKKKLVVDSNPDPGESDEGDHDGDIC